MTGTQHGRDIHVWDARRGVRVAIIPARGYSTAQFSPDGKLVATTSQGEPTCLREIESWEPKLTLKESGHVVFSHDSQLLAMTIDRTIKLLDVRDGKEFVTLKAPEELPIGGVAFARDNDRMAVGCFNFHTIQIWNLHQIRQRLAELKLDWEQLPIASGPMSSGAAHMKLNVILQDR